MKISELPNCPKWLSDADTVDADVEWSPYETIWWNRGEFRGGAFLGGSFRGGSFWGDKLTRNPLSIYGLRWPVVISEKKMQIGCERHQIEDWAAFDDARIVQMDRGALKFWRAHKAQLMGLCETMKPGDE